MRSKSGRTSPPPRSLRGRMATLQRGAWPSRRLTEHLSLHRLRLHSRQLSVCQVALQRQASRGHGSHAGSAAFLFLPPGHLLLHVSSRYTGDTAASPTELLWPSWEGSIIGLSPHSAYLLHLSTARSSHSLILSARASSSARASTRSSSGLHPSSSARASTRSSSGLRPSPPLRPYGHRRGSHSGMPGMSACVSWFRVLPR